MTAKTELDLCVDFSQFAPHLKVSAGILEMPLGAVDQVLEDFRLLQDAERKAFPASYRLNRGGSVLWLALKLFLGPLPVDVLGFPRCIATGRSIRYVVGAVSAVVHVVKKIPIAHSVSRSLLARLLRRWSPVRVVNRQTEWV